APRRRRCSTPEIPPEGHPRCRAALRRRSPRATAGARGVSLGRLTQAIPEGGVARRGETRHCYTRRVRVALVHDWLTGMRGGERCLEVFCELFPDADLYTLLHAPGSVSAAIERRRIVTSFVQRLPAAVLRRWDRRSSGRVDRFVAISRHVAARTERCYGRRADVIHPPVEVSRFRLGGGPGEFYLVVSALTPYKRVDVAAAAANQLGA